MMLRPKKSMIFMIKMCIEKNEETVLRQMPLVVVDQLINLLHKLN